MKKDVLVFVEHILACIDNIESFMKNYSWDDFSKNIEKQSAVIRQIEIIGEAVWNLPLSFRNKYPNVSWKEIVGMKNKLVHNYFGVNLKTVWQVIKGDIPTLKKQIKKIKKDLEQ